MNGGNESVFAASKISNRSQRFILDLIMISLHLDDLLTLMLLVANLANTKC